MATPSRIRTPLVQRWHRFRQQVLPVVCFLVCAAITLWLWERQARSGNAVGSLDAPRIEVRSGAPGMIVSRSPLPSEPGAPLDSGEPTRFWTVFDPIQEGDVIARLDDNLLTASLLTLRADLGRLRKELDAAEVGYNFDMAQYESDNANRGANVQQDRVRAMLELQQHRLDRLERVAQNTLDELEVKRLQTRLDYLQRAGLSPMAVDDAKAQLDIATKRLANNKEVLAEVIKQEATAEQLVAYYGQKAKNLPTFEVSPLEKLLAPLQEAITVQQLEIEKLQLQIEGLAIRAPISGTIAAVHSIPGQVVQPGDPIVTIASGQADYIVSYVRQAQRIRPFVDMKVTVKSRQPGSQPLPATVVDVGAQFELIPQPHLADPMIIEYGLPIRISRPPGLEARPGELLEINFGPSRGQEPG